MRAALLLPLVLLGGCMKLSEDGKMNAVSQFSKSTLNENVTKIDSEQGFIARDTRVKALLKKPLTLNNALCIALLNNHALQAAFAELGVSEAQLVQATLPPSPGFAFAQMRGPSMLEIERSVVVSLLSLLTLPQREKIASIKLEQAQSKAMQAVLLTAQNTRRAYFDSLASQEMLSQAQESQKVALTLSRLLKKLGESGAVNKLSQAREHVYYAETAAQSGTLRLTHQANLEKLTRTLGLFEKPAFKIGSKLPVLPRSAPSSQDLERQALKNRLDLKQARLEITGLAREQELTQSTQFISMLSVKAIHVRDKNYTEATTDKINGFDLDFAVPLYDFGKAKNRETEQKYMQGVHLLLEKTVQARSEAREAHLRLQGAFQLAKHYQNNILPLRETIKQETLLRYNAMQIDVIGLVNDEKARLQSHMAAIDAKKAFFIAQTDLISAIYGTGATMSSMSSTAKPQADAGGGH